MIVKQAYTEWSSTYDSSLNRTRDLDASVTRAVLQGMPCRAVLEIGCGTGKNTEFLVTIAERVLALDFSEGMLQIAREKVVSPHVTFAVADLTLPWPVSGHSFDLIVGNLVLEHIEDLGFVFSEAARYLLPGGHLFLSELHPFRQYQGTQANFQNAEGNIQIPAFVHNISDFLTAAETSGLRLVSLKEWWHTDDTGLPPRLLSLLFPRPNDETEM